MSGVKANLRKSPARYWELKSAYPILEYIVGCSLPILIPGSTDWQHRDFQTDKLIFSQLVNNIFLSSFKKQICKFESPISLGQSKFSWIPNTDLEKNLVLLATSCTGRVVQYREGDVHVHDKPEFEENGDNQRPTLILFSVNPHLTRKILRSHWSRLRVE